MRVVAFVLLFGLVLVQCNQPVDTSATLQALYDEAWAFQLAEDPLFATSVGVHDADDRLPSVAEPDQARRVTYWHTVIERSEAVNREELNRSARINLDIFKQQVEARLADYEFGAYLVPLNADSGFHISFARLADEVPLETVAEYENYISRLRAAPAYFEQHIELMQAGMERGITLPRIVLDGYEVTIASHLVDDPEDSVFYTPFATFPASFSDADQERLQIEGGIVIEEEVVSAYEAFLDFMMEEYIPNARETIAASELPNGWVWKPDSIPMHTATSVG